MLFHGFVWLNVVGPDAETEIDVEGEVFAINDADDFGPVDVVRLGWIFGLERGSGQEERHQEDEALEEGTLHGWSLGRSPPRGKHRNAHGGA